MAYYKINDSRFLLVIVIYSMITIMFSTIPSITSEPDCREGETRGESGYCAPMPKECPPGTAIDEDPACEPRLIIEQAPESQSQEDTKVVWANLTG